MRAAWFWEPGGVLILDADDRKARPIAEQLLDVSESNPSELLTAVVTIIAPFCP